MLTFHNLKYYFSKALGALNVTISQVRYLCEELRVKQILDAVGTVRDLRALLLTSDLELKMACGDDAVTALLIGFGRILVFLRYFNCHGHSRTLSSINVSLSHEVLDNARQLINNLPGVIVYLKTLRAETQLDLR
jgi:hypothetical protein